MKNGELNDSEPAQGIIVLYTRQTLITVPQIETDLLADG